MELLLGILQALGIFIVVPALVGITVGGSFMLRDRRVRTRSGVGQPTCSVDTDCPEGYVCRDGVCVPASA